MFTSHHLGSIHNPVEHDFSMIYALSLAIQTGNLPDDNYDTITATIQKYSRLLLEISLLLSQKTTWQENFSDLTNECPDITKLAFTNDSGTEILLLDIIGYYYGHQTSDKPFAAANFSDAESSKIIQLCLKLRQTLIIIKDTLNPLSIAKIMPDDKIAHMTINRLENNQLFLAVKTILQVLHFVNACAFGKNVPSAAVIDNESSEKFNLKSENFIAHRANIIKKCCQSSEINTIFSYFLNDKDLKNQKKLNQLEQAFYFSQQVTEVVYQLNHYLYINEAQLIAKTMLACLDNFFHQKINHKIKHMGGIKIFDLKLDYLNLAKELAYSYLFQKNYLQSAVLASKHHQRSLEWFPGVSRDDAMVFNHAIAILYACETNNMPTASAFFTKIESLVTKHTKTKKNKTTEQSAHALESIITKALASADVIAQHYAKLATATALSNSETSLAYSEQQLLYLQKQLQFWHHLDFDINQYECNTPSSPHNKEISHHSPFLFSSQAIIKNKVKILEKFIATKRALLAPPITIAQEQTTIAPIPSKIKPNINPSHPRSSSSSSSSNTPNSTNLDTNTTLLLPVSSYTAMANSLQKRGKPVVGKSKESSLSLIPAEQAKTTTKKSINNVTWPISNHSFRPNSKDNEVYTLSNEPYVPTGTWYTWLDQKSLNAAGASDQLIKKINAILARGLLTSKNQGIVCMDKKYQQKNSNYCYKIRLLGKEYGDIRIYGYIAEKVDHQSLIIFDHIEFKGHKPYLLPDAKTPSAANIISFGSK